MIEQLIIEMPGDSRKVINKARELVLQNANYTSDWTSLNKPGERPTAQHEYGMGTGRAIQLAILTAMELEKWLPLATETKHGGRPEKYSEFWTEVLQVLKQLNEAHLKANL